MSTPDARLGELARAAGDDGWYNAAFLRAFIDGDDEQCIPDEDAAYIAAASPSVILALLERTAELEAALHIREVDVQRFIQAADLALEPRATFVAIGSISLDMFAALEPLRHATSVARRAALTGEAEPA